MDIDSKDDEWLLEAAKQFQCASEDQGAVQDKYKVRGFYNFWQRYMVFYI